MDCNAADVTTAAGGGTSEKETYDFDLFALGGGTAGVRAARLSASMGKTPTLPPTAFTWIPSGFLPIRQLRTSRPSGSAWMHDSVPMAAKSSHSQTWFKSKVVLL